MPDLTEAIAAISRRPFVFALALAAVVVLVACPREEIGPRTLGFEIIQGR